MQIAKYFYLISGFIWPENAAVCKKLRGNIMQIKFNDGEKECYVFLPYSVPAKRWKKVRAIIPHPEQQDKDIQVDVTNLVMKVCGPGKDFYNIQLTPRKINRLWKTLTFEYRKSKNKEAKTIVFQPDDVITGL